MFLSVEASGKTGSLTGKTVTTSVLSVSRGVRADAVAYDFAPVGGVRATLMTPSAWLSKRR